MKESEKMFAAAKEQQEKELRDFVNANQMIKNFGLYLEPHNGKNRIIAVDRNMRVVIGRSTDLKKAEKKIGEYLKMVETENHSAKSGWGTVVKDMLDRYKDSSVIKFLHDDMGKSFLIICKVMDISISTARRRYKEIDQKDYKSLYKDYEYLITGII